MKQPPSATGLRVVYNPGPVSVQLDVHITENVSDI